MNLLPFKYKHPLHSYYHSSNYSSYYSPHYFRPKSLLMCQKKQEPRLSIQLRTGQAEQVVFIDLLVQRQTRVTTSVLVQTCGLNPEGVKAKKKFHTDLGCGKNTGRVRDARRRRRRHPGKRGLTDTKTNVKPEMCKVGTFTGNRGH